MVRLFVIKKEKKRLIFFFFFFFVLVFNAILVFSKMKSLKEKVVGQMDGRAIMGIGSRVLYISKKKKKKKKKKYLH